MTILYGYLTTERMADKIQKNPLAGLGTMESLTLGITQKPGRHPDTMDAPDPALPAEKAGSKVSAWDRWTIICGKDFKQKITAIAEKEGFSIREVVEKFFADGIAAYEAKHGTIDTTPKRKKDIDSLT